MAVSKPSFRLKFSLARLSTSRSCRFCSQCLQKFGKVADATLNSRSRLIRSGVSLCTSAFTRCLKVFFAGGAFTAGETAAGASEAATFGFATPTCDRQRDGKAKISAEIASAPTIAPLARTVPIASFLYQKCRLRSAEARLLGDLRIMRWRDQKKTAAAPNRGRGRFFHIQSGLDLLHGHQFDATVLSAALRRVVGGDRVGLAVSVRDQLA